MSTSNIQAPFWHLEAYKPFFRGRDSKFGFPRRSSWATRAPNATDNEGWWKEAKYVYFMELLTPNEIKEFQESGLFLNQTYIRDIIFCVRNTFDRILASLLSYLLLFAVNAIQHLLYV